MFHSYVRLPEGTWSITKIVSLFLAHIKVCWIVCLQTKLLKTQQFHMLNVLSAIYTIAMVSLLEAKQEFAQLDFYPSSANQIRAKVRKSSDFPDPISSFVFWGTWRNPDWREFTIANLRLVGQMTFLKFAMFLLLAFDLSLVPSHCMLNTLYRFSA